MTHCEVRQLLYVLLQYFFNVPCSLIYLRFFPLFKKKIHTGKKNDFLVQVWKELFSPFVLHFLERWYKMMCLYDWGAFKDKSIALF